MAIPIMATDKNTLNMARFPIFRLIQGTSGMKMKAGIEPNAMKLAIWSLVPFTL